MSFSSTLCDPPLKKSRQSLSLSEALDSLGFEPARTQNYDWMTAYPDAIGLLDAIRTSLDPSSVLSTAEVVKLESLNLSHNTIAPGDLIDAAQPLINAPFVKDLGAAREAMLNSARNRVQLLKIQREVLQDALRQKREKTVSSGIAQNGPERTPTHAKVSRLLSKTEVLKHYARHDLDRVRSELEIMRYCEKEAKHCETIASVITQAFRDDMKGCYDHQANMTSRTKRAINICAKLKQKQCLYRALVIRDAAMIASLGTNDGRYLEMTASSMVSLIKELRSSAAKAMQGKARQVLEQARESLENEVSHFSLLERAKQQDAYIDGIRQCISLYLEQRLRIHSLKVAAGVVATRRDHILALLQTVTPTKSSAVPNVNGTLSKAYVGGEGDQASELSTPLRDTGEATETCHICKEDNFSLEDLENRAFSSHVEAVASQISSVTRNTGESSSWLRLSSHPQCDLLIQELEDQLGKNTVLLEALLQKKTSILEKASPSSQGHSPSRSWISRINASHSPKFSSYSSSSSR